MTQHSNTKQQAVIGIIKGIKLDISGYKQLEQLMLKQQQCYLNFNAEQLNVIVEQQQSLIEKLQFNAQQRSAHLSSIGLSPTKHSMDRLIQALPTALQNELSDNWKLLESLVNHCQKINQGNGKLTADFAEMLQKIHENNSIDSGVNSYSTGNLMQL